MADEKISSQPIDSVDKILHAEDPEFAKGLGQLKVETHEPLEAIESLAPLEDDDDNLPLDTQFEVKSSSHRRLFRRFKTKLQVKWIDLKLLLRTQPKELVFYLIAQSKNGSALARQFFRRLSNLSRAQKLALIAALVFAGAAIRLADMNLKGLWLPNWNNDFLSNYEAVADKVSEVSPSDMVLVRTALPQPEFQVLLDKFVVNLKRRPGVIENPMGTFEMYLGVDSKEAAVEIRARQKELIDLVSRAIEGLTYPEATGELGTEKIKSVVKDSLNQDLSQGYVTRVYFRTAITKP
jgi:flagellar basal body-associated protein FliL